MCLVSDNVSCDQQGQIEAALKEAFLKTDSDLLTSEGMSECEAIRREIARRFDLPACLPHV